MAKPAGDIASELAPGRTCYELPLSERMRTFLRLEFLYQQLLYYGERDTLWATRATIMTLLDIVAILSRGDVRSEVLKELDAQIKAMERYRSQPGVDTRRLDGLIRNLVDNRNDVVSTGTQYLQAVKECEFLSSIKHRSGIPGGTCEFDLPEYSHWLRQPFQRREQDLARWIEPIRPLCDAVVEVLWLVRESADPSDRTALNGMFQHSMQKDASCRLLRVTLGPSSTLFPEISGSQHRFTIRFLEWSTIDKRAVQTGHDVKFQLAIC